MKIVKKCKLLCIFRFGTVSFMRSIAEGKGDCWDNAVAESFFHSLKTELIHYENFLTRKQARQVVSHGHILINGKRVNIASYRVKAGDVVAVAEASKNIAIIKEAVEEGKSEIGRASCRERVCLYV